MLGGRMFWELTEAGEKYIEEIRNNTVPNTINLGDIIRHVLTEDLVVYNSYAVNWYRRLSPNEVRNLIHHTFLNDWSELHTGIIPARQPVTPLGSSEESNTLLGLCDSQEHTYYQYALYWKLVHLIINRLEWKDITIVQQKFQSHFTSADGRFKHFRAIPNLRLLISKYYWGVTFYGDFYLDRPLTQDEVAVIKEKKLKFNGRLFISHYGGEYNFQTTFPFKGVIMHPVFNESNEKDYVEYNSIKEYMNRPERLERLEKQRKEKEGFKTLVELGFTPCVDYYGLRIKLQDHVAFKAYKDSDQIKLGVVIGCTAKRLVIKEISSGFEYQVASTNATKI